MHGKNRSLFMVKKPNVPDVLEIMTLLLSINYMGLKSVNGRTKAH
jgi:hypothetical protein